MALEDSIYKGLVPHLGEIGLVVAGIWADATSTMASIKKYGIEGEMAHKHRKKMQEGNPYHYLAKSAATQSLVFAGIMGSWYVTTYPALSQMVPEPSTQILADTINNAPAYWCYGLASQSFYVAASNLAGFLGLHKIQKALFIPIDIALAVFDPKRKTYRKP